MKLDLGVGGVFGDLLCSLGLGPGFLLSGAGAGLTNRTGGGLLSLSLLDTFGGSGNSNFFLLFGIGPFVLDDVDFSFFDSDIY